MKKILRRKCIIRQYDFLKVKARDPLNLLYDTYDFTPFTKRSLDQEMMWADLSGKELNRRWWDAEPPKVYISGFRDYLYDTNYLNWNIWYDDSEYICIQARKNTPESFLGWGIFTKEYDTNT